MDTNKFETISYERERDIATVQLERPEKKNALSERLSNELVTAAEDFDSDDAARVLVITGAGDAFSAGADIGKLQNQLTSQLDSESTIDDALTYEPLKNF